VKVTSVKVIGYKLKLKAPVHTAVGMVEEREGCLLRLEGEDGQVGWGDAAPWPGFGSTLAVVKQAMQNVLVAGGALLQAEFRNTKDIAQWLQGRSSLPREVLAAVDVALLDLLAQSLRRSVAEVLSTDPREVLSMHALVADAAAAKEAVKQGARTLKVKVGVASVQEDVARVGAVRAAAGRDIDIRVDANRAWTRAQAAEAVKGLAAHHVAWIEEPLALLDGAVDWAGMAELQVLAKQAGTVLAVDESVQTVADVERVAEARAATVVVLKPMFVGGLLAAMELHRKVVECGLKVVVTHAMESAVGRMAAIHLAAALDGHLPACGLANPLAEDVAVYPADRGGWLEVPQLLGLGVSVNEWYARQPAAEPAPLSGGKDKRAGSVG
jgi:o-succinylbenzoate synthase